MTRHRLGLGTACGRPCLAYRNVFKRNTDKLECVQRYKSNRLRNTHPRYVDQINSPGPPTFPLFIISWCKMNWNAEKQPQREAGGGSAG